MKRKNSNNMNTFGKQHNTQNKSSSGFSAGEEYHRKYEQLDQNEVDELKHSLYYVESKLEREMDVNQELAQKSELDRRSISALEKKLGNIIKAQAAKIEMLNSQLSDFTGNQGRLVQNLKNKFQDYGKEINERDEKIDILRSALGQTKGELENAIDEKNRYLNELQAVDDTVKEKDTQIKRLRTELNIAEKTIEEFVNCKEKKVNSFFNDNTIYTDAKKIESILTSLDDTKKDYSRLGLGNNPDESQINN